MALKIVHALGSPKPGTACALCICSKSSWQQGWPEAVAHRLALVCLPSPNESQDSEMRDKAIPAGGT